MTTRKKKASADQGEPRAQLPPLSHEQLAALTAAVRAGEEAVTQADQGVAAAVQAMAKAEGA